MKFTVHRTSDWSPDPYNPPLPYCVFEERTENKLVKGGYWPDTGQSYYIEEDEDISTGSWVMEVASLEQLMKILADQEHSFIISKPSVEWPDYPDIEIYDDYRE